MKQTKTFHYFNEPLGKGKEPSFIGVHQRSNHNQRLALRGYFEMQLSMNANSKELGLEKIDSG